MLNRFVVDRGSGDRPSRLDRVLMKLRNSYWEISSDLQCLSQILPRFISENFFASTPLTEKFPIFFS